MIKYQLVCVDGHVFEGWFRSSEDYDRQAAAEEVICPVCETAETRKAIMAPAVSRRGDKAPRALQNASRREARLQEVKAQVAEAADRARAYIEKNFDYVGESFPEEARRMHYGETSERQIFGEATPSEAKELVEEGVAIAPVPGGASPEKASDIAGAAIPKSVAQRKRETLEPAKKTASAQPEQIDDVRNGVSVSKNKLN